MAIVLYSINKQSDLFPQSAAGKAFIFQDCELILAFPWRKTYCYSITRHTRKDILSIQKVCLCYVKAQEVAGDTEVADTASCSAALDECTRW